MLAHTGSTAQVCTIQGWERNSVLSEFAPVLWNNGLVFCSSNKDQFAVVWNDEQNNIETNLYYTSESDTLENQQQYFQTLNTHLNEGPCSFSPDGKTICFTRTIVHPDRKKDTWLGLYFSTFENGQWSTATPFEHNSPDGSFNIAHPTYSPDGSNLYFASDRSGGEGKMDIWKCAKGNNSGWSQPINVASGINTPGNEIFPYFSQDGRLFFSGDLRDGASDFDIYYMVPEVEDTVLPFARINSELNEYGITLNQNGITGFFSSDRSGNSDIFKFELSTELEEVPACIQVEKPAFCFEIMDERIEYQPELPLKYSWDFGDGTSGNGLISEHCYQDFGVYTAQLNIFDTLTNLLYAQVSQTEIEITNPKMPFIETNGKQEIQSPISFRLNKTYYPEANIENAQWNFGDGSSGSGETLTKAWFTPGEYEVTVHFSSVENENKKQCVSRILTIADLSDYITYSNSENIDSFEEVDQQKTIAGRDSTADESIYFIEFQTSLERIPFNEEYFSEVEYEITERFIAEEARFHYSVGSAQQPGSLYPVFREMIEAGYNSSLVKESSAPDFATETTATGKHISASTPMEDSNIVNAVHTVFFDKNSWQLGIEAKNALQKLMVSFAENEQMEIIIRAYADTSGSTEFNQYMTEQRANSVRKYFLSQTISPKRIEIFAMGEAVPENTEGTEYSPALYRRAEIELIDESGAAAQQVPNQ